MHVDLDGVHTQSKRRLDPSQRVFRRVPFAGGVRGDEGTSHPAIVPPDRVPCQPAKACINFPTSPGGSQRSGQARRV